MKTDMNGVSQCQKGTEQYELYKSGGKTFCQYDFRTTGGHLFSCIRSTLEECRKKRDEWLRGWAK